MTIKDFPSTENIKAIVIPLPGWGDLITSNVYVLGTGPVTLVDTGPKFPGCIELIEKELSRMGFGFSDIERIILTHGHIDHFGNTARIVKESGRKVPCHMHVDDIWRVSPEYISTSLWGREIMDFVRMANLPEIAVERMKMRTDLLKRLCDPLEEVVPMGDGDVFTGPGFTLEVIHTPGHSPGSCCLSEKEKGVLFTGDHIISHITPNPIMEPRRSLLTDPDYQSLREYEKSLMKLDGLPVRYVFSGHGEYVDDLPGIIARYRYHHEKRKLEILEALDGTSKPVYDLVADLFPDIPETEVFLAISEIFSHLEVLMNEGRARMLKAGPPALFQKV